MQNHVRTSSMLPILTNAYLSIASCFWTWWRSMPSEQSLSTKFPYLKARKYLHITDQWVNVAPDVLQDLILHSKGAVISTIESFLVVNGAIGSNKSNFKGKDKSLSDWPPLSRGPSKGFCKGIQKALFKGADKASFGVKGFPFHLLAPPLPIFFPLPHLKLVLASIPSCSHHVYINSIFLHFSACCQPGHTVRLAARLLYTVILVSVLRFLVVFSCIV